MMKRMLPVLLMLCLMGQTTAPGESVAQLEAKLKTLKTQVAEVETKLAAARLATGERTDLTAILTAIPANLRGKQGERPRDFAARNDWVVNSASGKIVTCKMVVTQVSEKKVVGKLSAPDFSTINVEVALEAPPAEKIFERDTVVVTGAVESAGILGGKLIGESHVNLSKGAVARAR